MDEREKRPYVASGSTPNKGHGKLTFAGPERPLRRTLAFQGKGSPLQKVLYLLELMHLMWQLFCAVHTRGHCLLEGGCPCI